MLKLAVVGAQMLQGRELVDVLGSRDCSVLPLATGALTREQEEGDLVMFAPSPALLEGLDAVILADTPTDPTMLEGFQGRILDLREAPNADLVPMPLVGGWPEGVKGIRGRRALDQVLAVLPQLVEGFAVQGGTHLRSVAYRGDTGVEGLMAQTVSVLQGEEPNLDILGYRAAFEVVPQVARGRMVEVLVPVFHGDLLILYLAPAAGGAITRRPEAPQGCSWVDAPPTSREVAVSPDLLAHLSPIAEDGSAVLTLGFDPVLWGTLRPVLRVLGL